MTDARFSLKVPDGDDRPRPTCDRCGYVAYENPKIVVGSVATFEGRVLLCRRAIEPRRGFWTIPAGYLELEETPEEGAIREAWEEARAKLALHDLLAVYTVRRLSQVQLFYRAMLVSPEIEAGPESLEVGLFAPEEIPTDELAFPTVRWALAHHLEALGQPVWTPRTNPPDASTDIPE